MEENSGSNRVKANNKYLQKNTTTNISHYLYHFVIGYVDILCLREFCRTPKSSGRKIKKNSIFFDKDVKYHLVASRTMLFDELFSNLTRGFFNANYQYINLCFGHLLATFIYANRTNDDLMEEQNPGISHAINFMEQNLGKKLSLDEIAEEAGYSPSYLTTLFRKKTGYSPSRNYRKRVSGKESGNKGI